MEKPVNLGAILCFDLFRLANGQTSNHFLRHYGFITELCIDEEVEPEEQDEELSMMSPLTLAWLDTLSEEAVADDE